MMINKVQAASIVMLMTLFTVPSLAFPGGSETKCYHTELFYGDTSHGVAKLRVSGGGSILEIEIKEFLHQGLYNVELIKNYYSSYVAGELDIDEEGNGEGEYVIPYIDPDFIVRITDGEYSLVSGEWVECEHPVKPDKVKVSPQTLNLKSMGKWVTVKITIPTDPEPTDYELRVGESTPIEPVSVKVALGHVTLKFSRAELMDLCEEGSTEVTISFKIGEDTIELRDIIKVINEGNQEATPAHQVNNQIKSNNGKSKGKSNGKANGKNKGN